LVIVNVGIQAIVYIFKAFCFLFNIRML
jgi:hypothetical protein